jgi:hypothetical protein
MMLQLGYFKHFLLHYNMMNSILNIPIWCCPCISVCIVVGEGDWAHSHVLSYYIISNSKFICTWLTLSTDNSYCSCTHFSFPDIGIKISYDDVYIIWWDTTIYTSQLFYAIHTLLFSSVCAYTIIIDISENFDSSCNTLTLLLSLRCFPS